MALPVLLRKRRLVVRVPVSARGRLIVDKQAIPVSAIVLTGVNVFAQARPGSFSPAVPVFIHGASATTPTTGADLVRGVLTLATNGQPATAQFNQSAGAGEYIFYGYPAALPAPVFTYQGFTGGFVPAGSVWLSVTDGAVTSQVAFYMYCSVTPNLGAGVAITVIHP